MDKNNANENIDKAFKQGLNDFQVPPPSFAQQDDRQELEHQLRSKLNGFEVEPDRSNWDQIKNRIPLSLKLHRQLNFWSKVAAVLVVGMIGTLMYSNFRGPSAPSVAEFPPAEEVEVIVESDAVYPVSAPKVEMEDEVTTAFKAVEPLPEPVPTLELPPLPTKSLVAVENKDNILNETIQRDTNISTSLDKRLQAPIKEEMMGLQNQDKTADQKNN